MRFALIVTGPAYGTQQASSALQFAHALLAADIPEELQSLINERKKNPFSLTFTDQSYLYVVRGYGKQSCGGYKITVNDFCKREDGLYFDTELFGPKSDNPDERSSYPYIVIKTEYVDLPVSFSK